ncbi:MAG: PhoH family protein [Candidatus Moraniibacteriota bacterium]
MASIQPKLPKLFVLDTNVLMHDPTALFRFEDNNVYLPMMTLEELDNHKKGMTEIARNARQTSRYFDQLLGKFAGAMEDGIPLDLLDDIKASGRLYFQSKMFDGKLPASLPNGKADNQILGVVQGLKDEHPDRSVILVTKDINMRVKARALGLLSEDYQSDQVLGDSDILYSGICELPAGSWEKQRTTVAESWKAGDRMCYRLMGPVAEGLIVNQFVYDEQAKTFQAIVQERSDKSVVLRTLRNYDRYPVWGIAPRNRWQNFALNLLMDPECDFVTLAGQAGTGKTLMTLAAGLQQVFEDRRYSEMIVTRVTVPVGDDIGFLPGDEQEKMGPWMGALDDNLEVLENHSSASEWGRAATNDLIRNKIKIKIKSLNFMRGRTFLNKFVLIDEAQNLTPKQMKMLITRVGPGTKIVCLGNLAQIDTPYLTEGGSGLTYAIDRFKGWSHAGHVTLVRPERSRLADYAVEVL